jgi:tRNA(Ser,Leu) C12 N-acetylase TAN1
MIVGSKFFIKNCQDWVIYCDYGIFGLWKAIVQTEAICSLHTLDMNSKVKNLKQHELQKAKNFKVGKCKQDKHDYGDSN